MHSRVILMLALWSVCFLSEAAVAGQQGQKIRFSNSQSVGTLTLMDQSFAGHDKHPKGLRFGQAVGSLILPADKRLMISFFDNLQENRNALSSLPPQVIAVLDFHGTGADDAVVNEIISLPAASTVKVINLEGTEVSDKCLSSLSKLRELYGLNLGSTNLTGVDLAKLSQIDSLRSLQMANNQLSPQAFKNFVAFKKVMHLNLSRTGFSDQHVENLGSMNGLRELELSDNLKLTDKGLDRLRAITHLRLLDLRHTGVTPKGILAWKGSKLEIMTINKNQFAPAVENKLVAALKPVQLNVDDRNANKHEELFAPLR